MPGKGKRKEKGKSKNEERETKFDKKQIDVVCLAHDIFVYSASKFGVHENCLAKWEGPENDYGELPYNFGYICRPVIVNQLKFRYVWYELIECRLKNDALESFEPVGQALENIIESLPEILKDIELVEASLAVACELILYLHAKDKCLYLKQLADKWFECYFRKAKKQFEKQGGFESVCWRGYNNVRDYPHNFINLCITSYKYNDYEKSVQDVAIGNKFLKSSTNHTKKKIKYKCPKPSFVLKKKFENFLYQRLPTPKPVRDSEDSLTLTPNSALGVPLPEDMYPSLLSGDSAQSQNLPEANVQEQSKRSRPSYLERKRAQKASSRKTMEKVHGQSSIDSRTKLKVPAQNQSSSGLQTDESSLYSRALEQGIGIHGKTVEKMHGQSSIDCSRATDRVQSCEQHGAKRKIPAQTASSSGLQADESSLYPRVEQGIGQLSIDPEDETP